MNHDESLISSADLTFYFKVLFVNCPTEAEPRPALPPLGWAQEPLFGCGRRHFPIPGAKHWTARFNLEEKPQWKIRYFLKLEKSVANSLSRPVTVDIVCNGRSNQQSSCFFRCPLALRQGLGFGIVPSRAGQGKMGANVSLLNGLPPAAWSLSQHPFPRAFGTGKVMILIQFNFRSVAWQTGLKVALPTSLISQLSPMSGFRSWQNVHSLAGNKTFHSTVLNHSAMPDRTSKPGDQTSGSQTTHMALVQVTSHSKLSCPYRAQPKRCVSLCFKVPCFSRKVFHCCMFFEEVALLKKDFLKLVAFS